MPNPVGKPTVMTPEALLILEDAFSVGATDEQACFLAKISPEALYAYQRRNPEYVQRKIALKNMPKYAAKKNVVAALHEGDKDVSKWYLERRDKQFKPKSDITSDDEGLQQVLVKFLDGTEQNNRDTDRVQETV